MKRVAAPLVGAAILLSGCGDDPTAKVCDDLDHAVLAASDAAKVGTWMDLALEDARSDLPEDNALRRDLEFLATLGGGSYLQLVTVRANHCK